jgi:twinkle protein
VDEFHRSKRFTLGGIINGADTWDKYKEKKNIKSIPWDPQYVELNQKTYGMRLGEIVLITAGTGSGKTQVLREWKYHLLQNTDYNIMDISLEEDVGDTIGGLMAIHANKRITLPDVDISEQEERKLHSELYGTGKFTLLDHEGSVGDESLLDKMEYAATVDNCKIQFLDHITIAVSDCEGGQENVTMDKFMNRLLKMVKRLNICVVVVSHLRKVGGGGKSFEEGRVPTEDDLKGSGSLKQIAMTTIAIARNKYAETEVERNTTSFHVLKCRFSGRTGPADYSHFDDETGRMTVIDPEEAENADNQFKDSPVGGY